MLETCCGKSLIEGNDSLVRVAHIRTDNCRTMRPIITLYPLEVVSNDNQLQEQQHTSGHIDEVTTTKVNCPAEVDLSPNQSNVRPRRNAATKALRRMKEWTDVLCCPPEVVEN